jgi:hypothetical protein
MAVVTVATGLDQTLGLPYTHTTDDNNDWVNVLADTYFYDKATKLVYYKNANGTVVALVKKTVTQASTATLTVDSTTTNVSELTAQAVGLTIGAPTGLGKKIIIRIKDNGTGIAIAYNPIFRAIGVTLPTTTTASKTLYLGVMYNAEATKWDVIAVNEEA